MSLEWANTTPELHIEGASQPPPAAQPAKASRLPLTGFRT